MGKQVEEIKYIESLERQNKNLQEKIEDVQTRACDRDMAWNILSKILKNCRYRTTKSTHDKHVICLEVGEVVISSDDIGFHQTVALEDLIDEISQNKLKYNADLNAVSMAFDRLCLASKEERARIRQHKRITHE